MRLKNTTSCGELPLRNERDPRSHLFPQMTLHPLKDLPHPVLQMAVLQSQQYMCNLGPLNDMYRCYRIWLSASHHTYSRGCLYNFYRLSGSISSRISHEQDLCLALRYCPISLNIPSPFTFGFGVCRPVSIRSVASSTMSIYSALYAHCLSVFSNF